MLNGERTCEINLGAGYYFHFMETFLPLTTFINYVPETNV